MGSNNTSHKKIEDAKARLRKMAHEAEQNATKMTDPTESPGDREDTDSHKAF